MGADPDFRRKRDEAMFREMDAEARSTQIARAEAAERVRWETQAALDLRVLHQAATAPGGRRRPPDLPAAAGRDAAARAVRGRDVDRRVATTGTASPGSGRRATTNTRPRWARVWVPPAQIAVSGTLVVRPGRWVRATGAPQPLIPRH